MFDKQMYPIKKTRFVTSSGAENHVTLYNTSVRSNKSNVNSSSFTTETNLFLFCKRDFLKLYWGSSALTNPSLMHSSMAFSIEHCCFLLSSTCFSFSNYSSIDNIFEYNCILSKRKSSIFHLYLLVGGMRKWMLR